MNQHFSTVLIGNTLSSMVAAAALAERGEDVAIVGSSKRWGGHFTTIECDGSLFDPGMVLYEFTSYNAGPGDPDPTTYNPRIRNDAGRFCGLVHKYVNKYQPTRDILSPSMHVGGKVYEDLLIANALTSLPLLPFAAQIRADLLPLSAGHASGPLHPSRKHDEHPYGELDYGTASLTNHGSTFHSQLIEPFCRKLFGIPTSDVLALYHRVAWLPLFYPETLLSYLGESPQPLPATIFSYAAGGCVGEFTNTLKEEIVRNDRITILAEAPTGMGPDRNGRPQLSLAAGGNISADRMAWMDTPANLLRILGTDTTPVEYDRSSISLAFVRIPTTALKRDFSVLSVVDPDILTYRVTNQTNCSGTHAEFVNVVAEFNPDYHQVTANSASAAGSVHSVATDLEVLGVIADPKVVKILDVKQMNKALVLPTLANKLRFGKEDAALTKATAGLDLLLPSTGFFASSLNDQVVQGLKVAATREHLA